MSPFRLTGFQCTEASSLSKETYISCSLRVHDGVVEYADQPGYRWAVGKTRTQLLFWLLRKKIPYRIFGWRYRKGEPR